MASLLPSHARYCPHCGRNLVAALHLPGPKSTLRERIEQLRVNLCDHLADDSPPPTSERLDSLVLLGYADAMAHLSWRYEQGQGVSRNLTEAERCYAKSAKLGNLYAKTKVEEGRDSDL